MNGVALELEETLRGLDARSAAALERAVRGVLALAAERPARATNGTTPAEMDVDANGWPVGYFAKHVGALAGDDWEPPADPPPEPTPDW